MVHNPHIDLGNIYAFLKERAQQKLTTLPPDLFDLTTLYSLAATIVLLIIAYVVSRLSLSRSTPTSLRILFLWHFWDALIHFTFEGSFLYNCFYTYVLYDTAVHFPPLHPTAGNNFLGFADRIYGSAYGDNPFAKLWQIYARADRRWGGSEPTVISLELLTVFGAGPIAVYVCYLLSKRDPMVYFWMTILAIAELYGGFITFAPEWLTGSTNLDTSNFMYFYVYLIFFNVLWVIFPIFAIHVAYGEIKNAFSVREGVKLAMMKMTKEQEKEGRTAAKQIGSRRKKENVMVIG